jgi:FXSXX-COOH protein
MGEEADRSSLGLIDLTGFNLSDLDQIDESRLGSALRRLLADEDIGPVAGFQSSI